MIVFGAIILVFSNVLLAAPYNFWILIFNFIEVEARTDHI